ncbi:MAG TPA: hypothetical protein VMU80_25320 [Bryobacteraceae bacterium]|nr:hypothetical protein [Bryobacteraceae bacterium]
MKSFLLIVAMAILTLPIASAKTYSILISSPTMAGQAQLAAGNYSVKVTGSTAVFTDKDNGKRITEAVKVQNGATKYSQTAIELINQGNTQRLTAIELGGSRTKVELD